MKNLIYLFSLMVIATVGTAQDKKQSLDNFDHLSVSGGISVNIYEGKPRIEVTMTKGEIEEFMIIQKGDRLKLKFKDKVNFNWSNNRNAKVDLYVPTLSSVDASAGSYIESDFTFETKEFFANVSSGASLSIGVDAKSLDADVSSGASMEVDGEVSNLNVDVSSGASYRGGRLKAADVDADVSSGGSIKVWAIDRLEADASSGGSIRYKGNPADTDIDAGKWSGGSISKI